MTTRKTPRNTSLLTATQAADKLAPLLFGLGARIDKARDEAEHDERQRTAEQIQRRSYRRNCNGSCWRTSHKRRPRNEQTHPMTPGNQC